jgi:hypothetical protein
MQRAAAAWPQRLTLHELLGPKGLAEISNDALLAAYLQRGSIFDLEIERFLTSLRAAYSAWRWIRARGARRTS